MFRGGEELLRCGGPACSFNAVESAFSTRKGVMSVVRRPQNAEYLSPLRMEYRSTGAICRDCGPLRGRFRRISEPTKIDSSTSRKT